MNNPLYLKDCLSVLNKEKYSLPIILGKDSNNDIHIKDLKELKNILISGSTHSGKSVFLNNVINTILLTRTPKEVQLILIDFKQAELYIYENISYLKYPVLYDPVEAAIMFGIVLNERERKKEKGESYPDIVIVLDEYSDLIGLEGSKPPVFRDFKDSIYKVLKMGHTLGIYTILSSSKVSDNELLRRIRESIPNRLVGSLATSEDSITMLGEEGAEELMGNGDMIFKDMNTGEKVSVQTPFISTQETESIVSSISKENKPKAMEVKEIEEEKDPLYEEAKQLVIEKKQASPTFLQKHLKIGYNHAARLIEQLEKDRVITPEGKNRKREILLDNYEPSIEEEVIKEENVKNEQQKPAGDIIWLTKEQVRDALHAKEEFPIKEIELLPFLQSDIHHPEISISTLVSGILKVYDYEDSKMLNTVYDVDVSKQKVWYKDLLLALVATEPREEVIEKSILNILFTLREHHGNEYVLPLWKNAIIFFPTSRIFCDYTSIMMDYLFEHPKERNEKIYKELQDIFKKIKKEEVEPRIWESMVLTNYCLTDLLGNDKSKAPYLGDIKQENLLKAINERSCFDILFGEEYI